MIFLDEKCQKIITDITRISLVSPSLSSTLEMKCKRQKPNLAYVNMRLAYKLLHNIKRYVRVETHRAIIAMLRYTGIHKIDIHHLHICK